MARITRIRTNSNMWLENALDALSAGYRPIPIKSNSKEPIIPWKEYQKHPPDKNDVEKWWKEYPNANLAIITGSASGVIVIDIDTGHDPWPPDGCSLPECCVIKTPRGGFHFYYTHIEGIRNSAGRLAKGIDVRGDGGYALIPPSIINGKSYELIKGSLDKSNFKDPPSWLIKALMTEVSRNTTSMVVSRIPEGQRNITLASLAGTMRRRGASEESILAALHKENTAKCNPPLPDTEVANIAKSIAKYEPEIPEIPKQGLTDTWNAIKFDEEYGELLHYVPAIKSWLFWDGTRWNIDKKLHVNKLMQDFVRGLWGKTGYIPESSDREKWIRHVKYTQSRKGIDALINLARSQGRIPLEYEDFDNDVHILNTESGIIKLNESTLEIDPLDHRPDNLITKICPIKYDPSATSNVWMKFLEKATCGDKVLEEFIQRCAGYCLVGKNPEEKFFFIWGPTASGKSTFIEAIKAAMGNYAVTINASVFLSQRSSGGPQPEVIKIKGARIVIASETEPGKKFNTDLIKGISGRDTIGARNLYCKPIEFKFGGKLWVVSNFAPKVHVEDEAFMRRIIVIPFNNSIPEEHRNPKIKTVLTNPRQSGPAILNWMIQGHFDYLDKGGLVIPDIVRKSLKDYKDEVNPITDFVKERCELDPGNHDFGTATGELYDAYVEYSKDLNNRYKVSKNRFGRCLRELGLESDRRSVDGARARTWIGIKLR